MFSFWLSATIIVYNFIKHKEKYGAEVPVTSSQRPQRKDIKYIFVFVLCEIQKRYKTLFGRQLLNKPVVRPLLNRVQSESSTNSELWYPLGFKHTTDEISTQMVIAICFSLLPNIKQY